MVEAGRWEVQEEEDEGVPQGDRTVSSVVEAMSDSPAKEEGGQKYEEMVEY